MWDRRSRQGLLSRNSYIVGERTNKLANKYVMKVLAGNRKQEMKVIKNDQDAVFDAWPARALLMRSHSCRGAITCTPGGAPFTAEGWQVQRPRDEGESSWKGGWRGI